MLYPVDEKLFILKEGQYKWKKKKKKSNLLLQTIHFINDQVYGLTISQFKSELDIHGVFNFQIDIKLFFLYPTKRQMSHIFNLPTVEWSNF